MRTPGGALAFWGLAEGLPDLWVSGAAFDPDGTIWLGTRSGLARLDPRSRTFRVYTSSSGLPGDIVWSVALGPGPFGRPLWIATDAGLTRFDGN